MKWGVELDVWGGGRGGGGVVRDLGTSQRRGGQGRYLWCTGYHAIIVN